MIVKRLREAAVLECSEREASRVARVIAREVLGGRWPQRVDQEDGVVRLRLPRKALGGLLDAFPQAVRSPAAARWENQRLRPPSETFVAVRSEDVPGFAGELYPFQGDGVGAATSVDAFLITDDMGLGKTIEALCSLAVKQAYPALVMSPNTFKWGWGREIEDKFPELRYVIVDGTERERKEQLRGSFDIAVINYEAVRLHPELVTIPWKGIVWDEFHRAKSVGAKLTQAAHRIQGEYKIGLSGTPLLNGRLEELWSPLHYFFPEEFPGDMSLKQPDWRFRRRYCVVKDGEIVGYRRREELRRKLHAVSIRRRKDEVLPELPEMVYSVREVELTQEQRRIYRSIRDDMRLWLEDGTPKRIVDVRARVVRLLQACFSPELFGGSNQSGKLVELKALVEELVSGGHKVVIFSQWAKAARIIRRELSDYETAYVDGKVKGRLRDDEIQRFQNDSDVVLYVGTIGANREGIALTAADYVIFTDLLWTPEYNRQAAARLHRIGQRNVVNVIELWAKGTYEEKRERVLEGKEEMNAYMVERGPVKKTDKRVIKTLAEIL